MPLELNGNPYTLTDVELLRKYSKEMVFTVSSQYIKINKDPDLRRVEAAPVHIPTFYNSFEMEDNVRISRGVLRYYEAKSSYNENGRAFDNFTPQYIAIGHSGVLKSSNPELNYFLDNSPFNQRVQQDSLHPNYDRNVAPICRTFSRTERAMDAITMQKKSTRLMSLLLDESVYTIERLRSLAMVVSQQASARKLAHKLFDYQTMEEVALRSELARLCQAEPVSMDEIMSMDSTDIAEEIEKWKSLRIIEFTDDNEWIFNETENRKRAIIKVPTNTDADKALLYYLKGHDPFYKWFKPINKRYEWVHSRMRKKQVEPENK